MKVEDFVQKEPLASRDTLDRRYPRSILEMFQEITQCEVCATTSETLDVYHIDGDMVNILPTNLIAECRHCRRREITQPLVTVVIRRRLHAAHYLPSYSGKCARMHGHEWDIVIAVQRRVDPRTGIALDFNVLKETVDRHVVDMLDHDLLNYHVDKPTAELLSVWIWERLMFTAKLKGLRKVVVSETADSVAEMGSRAMLDLFQSNFEQYVKQYSIAMRK